jgi:hypothetical protein
MGSLIQLALMSAYPDQTELRPTGPEPRIVRHRRFLTEQKSDRIRVRFSERLRGRRGLFPARRNLARANLNPFRSGIELELALVIVLGSLLFLRAKS